VDPLWAQLINSDWHDHLGSGRRADRIDDDRWLEGFLHRAGWRGRRLPGPRGRVRLRSLRTLLRRAVEALFAGAEPGDMDLAALNRNLSACPAVRHLERGADARLTLVLAPVATGIERVLGTVAASFAELLANGDPTRIKVCANPDCRWVILDESRNRSRRWCEEAVCGSLVKVRRFRSVKRSLGSAQAG
jgi:predicted RNA-binding Zn ribbon-like protein